MRRPLDDRYHARRIIYRIIYRISEDARTVTALLVDHRRDVYRKR